MAFSVGTNWDDELIGACAEYREVTDFFASLPSAVVGHGRPIRSVPKVTREEMRRHVDLIHRRGCTFTYLLNAPSLGGRQFEPEIRNRIVELLDWLADIGVDAVTVSLPDLLALTKRHHPQTSVKVSHNSTVLSTEQARMYQELGADLICLMRSTHRRFDLLKEMVETLSVPVQLIATSGCVNGCVNMVSLYHMSQTASLTREGREDTPHGRHGQGFCFSWCHARKLEKPEEILKAAFIRPEDLHRYEEIGVSEFKLDTRVLSTPAIMQRVKAYHDRRWEGDLQGLISVFQLAYETRVGTQMGTGLSAKCEVRGAEFERFFALAEHVDFGKLLKLDNRAVDGFIKGILKKPCPASCESCDYCERVAKKAQNWNDEEREKLLEILKAYRKALYLR